MNAKIGRSERANPTRKETADLLGSGVTTSTNVPKLLSAPVTESLRLPDYKYLSSFANDIEIAAPDRDSGREHEAGDRMRRHD